MNESGDAITPQAIARCEKIIRSYIRRTPVIATDGSEFGMPAGSLMLKLELLQHSGSFKARGAFTNLLTREIPKAGIVAASGGNHGAAVAYAAMRLGQPAKIFVPNVSSPAKIARIREYGADLTVAAWYAGRVKVIGVEPLASPTLTRAFEAGHPVDAEVGGLAADSLAPRRVGERVFPIVRKYAPHTVLVSDDAIAEAQKILWRALRIVAEPGGACAFSAIASGAYRPAAGERVAVVISGGNTTAVNFDVTR